MEQTPTSPTLSDFLKTWARVADGGARKIMTIGSEHALKLEAELVQQRELIQTMLNALAKLDTEVVHYGDSEDIINSAIEKAKEQGFTPTT